MYAVPAFTIVDGAWIFGAVVVVWLVAIAFGYYTRRGSAINQRAHGTVYTDAPGAKTPSVISHDQSAARSLLGGRSTTKSGETRRSPPERSAGTADEGRGRTGPRSARRR